jgi:hypothetical protein
MTSWCVAIAAFIALSLTGTVFLDTRQGYELLPLLPITYVLGYFLFAQNVIKTTKYKLTAYFTIITFAFVCLVGPSLYSLMGNAYQGNRYYYLNEEQIRFSIQLLAWNVFIGFFLLRFITSILSNYKKKDINESYLHGNKRFYIFFVIVIIITYFFLARGTGLISFFLVTSTTGEDHQIGTIELLLRQSTVISMSLIFLWTVDRANWKINVTEKNLFLVMLFFGVLLVGMIVGGRRSVQMFTAVLVIIFLIERFPKYRVTSIISVFGISAFVIAIVSLHRWYGGAGGGAYSFEVGFLALYFQSYFAGPDSVATPMNFFNYVRPGMSVLIFDFARSTFGISNIIKDMSLTTSQLYNDYVYSGEQLTGQLIFAPTYGYYYFGFIASPLILGLNILLASVFERAFNVCSSLEFKFLYLYCFLRVSFNLMVNTPTVITVVTMFIGTMGLLFYTSMVINRLNFKSSVR